MHNLWWRLQKIATFPYVVQSVSPVTSAGVELTYAEDFSICANVVTDT